MAYAAKEASVKPSVTTNTTIYQVTTGKELVIASLRIINMGSANETCQVGVSATATPGATEWIYKGVIAPDLPIQLSGDLITSAKYIVAYNATDANCIFKLSAWESV